jgi:hypothetical protein
MNGFIYDENEKKIRISDGTTTVVWENVEKAVAERAAKLYGESKSIDSFLILHNCKRFWGTNERENPNTADKAALPLIGLLCG